MRRYSGGQINFQVTDVWYALSDDVEQPDRQQDACRADRGGDVESQIDCFHGVPFDQSFRIVETEAARNVRHVRRRPRETRGVSQ